MRGWVEEGDLGGVRETMDVCEPPEIGAIVVYFISLAGNVTGNRR
jgi:hypothetical protein